MLQVSHHTAYLFYHTAFVASLSASPFELFIPVLSHCLHCFTECLTIWTLHTCSITLPLLLHWVPHHLNSSHLFCHTAFVASLSASPFELFTPVLSHCFLCLLCASPFVLILHTCSITLPSLLHWVPHHLNSSYLFHHTAFIASLSASPFILLIHILCVSQFFLYHFDTRPFS